MGWFLDDGTHEGYLVGLVFDDAGIFNGHARYPERKTGLTSGRMRELGGPADDREGGPVVKRASGRARALGATVELTHVKIACSCGWRSPLIRAWPGTSWQPCAVFAPQAFEDIASAIWAEHVHASGPAHDGGMSIAELATNGRAKK